LARPRKTGWGGKRKGAGRKRSLPEWDRKDIARDYFARRQIRRQDKPPRRATVIRELMAEYNDSGRMIERCIAEFLPTIRLNNHLWRYATEGLGQRQLLPVKGIEIKKLKAGIYSDRREKRLRLRIDRAGNRNWLFCFFLRSTFREMVLGGSEISLAAARENATKAARMLASGQNPIDSSWLSAALESVKPKS
jgi:Arm DNA-binding domain